MTTRMSETQETKSEAFGVRDSKGREIGADVYLYNNIRSEDHLSRYRDAEGNPFAYSPQATRDGSKYGASQTTYFFPTQEARDAAVAKYFSGARKRALRREG